MNRKILSEDASQSELVNYLESKQREIETYNSVRRELLKDIKYVRGGQSGLKAGKGIFGNILSFIKKDNDVTQGSDKETATRINSPFSPTNACKGVYIWGPSGTGKSIITDLFFNTLNVPDKVKNHFFEFVSIIHKSNHAKSSTCSDPLLETAKEISLKYSVVLLDEFQVTDIADAMILKRFFEILWAHGTVLVVL